MKKTILITLVLLIAVLLEGQTPRLVVPIGHTDFVLSVAFSPDGQQVLTGSLDGTAKLWDLSGREIQTFTGHAEAVQSVAFSPDGQQVLTGSDDHTAKLWDLSGREIQTFTGHTNFVLSVAFSPDGQKVLTGSWDGTAKLWDLSGREIQTFTGHANVVYSVAFSPDGQQVLTGSGDGTAKLWDLSGGEIQTFKDTSVVRSVAFSPNGLRVLTGSLDRTAKLWDLSGRAIQTFMGHAGAVSSVAFSPDGQKVLTGSGYMAKLWDLSAREIQTFTGHASNVTSVVFSPDGQKVLTGSWDYTARLWDLSGREIQTFMGHAGAVFSAVFSPDGQKVLTGSEDHTAKLWGLSGREIRTFTGHAEAVLSVAFSPDGQQVLTGSDDHTAKLWDLSGGEIQNFTGHAGSVFSVDFSPDGKTVLTGCRDRTAKLWDLSGGEIQTFTGHAEGVISVAFSPDGQKVLTGSGDGTAKLWDLSGRVIQTFTGHAGSVFSVAFSPNGQMVLTGSDDGTAKLWDLSGREIQTFKDTSVVRSVAFSPDGLQVLTGSVDQTAKLWNVPGGEIQPFSGHTNFINSVVFSPDGKTVLTGSADNTAKFWDTNTGRCLATLISLDSTDWVVTTPSGLFDASPGAMRLMYFVVGLEVIELEQLKVRYYEPGLLSKIMGFADEPLREVESFDSVALYPAVRLQLDTLQNKLHIHLGRRNGGVGKVSVFVNGKEVLEEANPPKGFDKLRDTAVVVNLEQYARYFLPDSLNEVSVRAYNAAGWLKSAPYNITYRPVFAGAKGNNQDRGAAPVRLEGAPNLFILSVGTANYAGTKLDLKFAGKDALDMANAFQQIGRQLFHDTPGKVISYILTTDNSAYPTPTKANIKQAFEAIKKEAKAADILLVYFSGHGIAKGDEFYYLTQDMSSFEVEIEGTSRTISNTELTRWINDIPALKQVLILDACNSGKVVESFALSRGLNSSQIRALEQLKDRTGMFVLTGSAADKVSYEAGQFGQGLLTYSLLEGIKGEVPDKFGHVDVMKLFRYACERVPELAKGIGGIQTPVPAGPLGKSFPIGTADSTVHISVASEKPVFIRNNFQDETLFDDGLGLTNALKDYLVDQTALGDATFIYVDVADYDDAWSIKGLYRINDGAVEVRGRLFKGKRPVGEAFNVKGKKDDLPGLVEAVVEEVLGMVDGQ